MAVARGVAVLGMTGTALFIDGGMTLYSSFLGQA
jgi:hypothetical protein